MNEYSFPETPAEVWKDDKGAQAIFTVPGADPMLGSYLNSLFPLAGLNEDWGWEIQISYIRPDQMMVVCSAQITESEFKQGLAIIIARFSCVTADEFKAFKEARIKAAMAVSSDDTFAWQGSAIS